VSCQLPVKNVFAGNQQLATGNFPPRQGRRMGRIGRWVGGLTILVVGIVVPIACTQHHRDTLPAPGTPVVRVRLLVGETAVTIRADVPPTIKTASESTP